MFYFRDCVEIPDGWAHFVENKAAPGIKLACDMHRPSSRVANVTSWRMNASGPDMVLKPTAPDYMAKATVSWCAIAEHMHMHAVWD